MTTQTFPLNTWYVVATPEEVTDKPLARTVCNLNLVFYRNEDNEAVALEDFCPHRGAPLSLGYVEDGKLVCGYHGLKMGGEGKTVSMPNQRVEKFPCITAYPLEERHGFIWLWPGDKDKIDYDLIPDLVWSGNKDWAYDGGLFHIECDYRLMIDNLMDLTHETYVHASSIGQKEIDEAPVNTKTTGQEVVTSRFMGGVYAPPFWQMALRANNLADDVLVDRWQICKFNLPSHVMIEVGVAHQGHGGYDAPAEFKAGSIVTDFITPATDTSILYFWGMARNFKPEDETLTANIKEGQGKIFTEDLEMLEKQQINLTRNPDKRVLKLDIDSGGVMSRRLIERTIKKEQQAKISTDSEK